MGLMLMLGVFGCGGPAVDSPSAAPVPLGAELGWVGEVAQHPDRFETLAANGRAGWVAFHAHDYAAAVSAFQTAGDHSDARIGKVRAELALSVLYLDLAALSGEVHERLFDGWSRKGSLPSGSEAPMVAALAAYCSGGESAATWAHKVSGGPDVAIAAAMTQGGHPLDVLTSGPFGRRTAMHRQARTSGDTEPLQRAALEPVTVVQEKDFQRQYWDPCVWATLSDVWLARALRDLAPQATNGPPEALPQLRQGYDRGQLRNLAPLADPEAGLASRLFAPWPSSSDLRAELATNSEAGVLGARAPSLRSIGLGTIAATIDDPQLAKDETARFDAMLDGARSSIAASPGASLVEDLDLTGRYRQEQLLVRARNVLNEGYPRQALAYLELARDHSTRGVGPENAPAVFTLLSRIELQLGHTREALDALQIVVDRYPEAIGLKEAANDLAVLQGLGVSGDSKEP